MRKKIIPYNPELKELARQLRRNSTLSMDNYIVDFFCNELMLAIEIDGETHNSKVDGDKERQARLEKLGIKFLRFTDMDVKQNIEGVIAAIEKWVKENTLPTPMPLPRGD